MTTFVFCGVSEQLTLSQALKRLFSLEAQGYEWVVVEKKGEAQYHVFEGENHEHKND